MADTIRTLADLLVLLADNTSGNISPQDVRDALVSRFGVYGQVYTSGGSTGVSVGTSPVTVEWDSDGLDDGLTADSANDRLSVGSGSDGVFLVLAQFSFTGTASTTFTLKLSVNGTQDDALACKVKLDASGSPISASFAGLVSLVSGDAVTVEVVADGASKTFTLAEGQLSLRRIA